MNGLSQLTGTLSGTAASRKARLRGLHETAGSDLTGAGSPAGEVLIFSNDGGGAQGVCEVLVEYGVTCHVLDFGESVQEALSDQVRGIFLIAGKVSEQTLGVVVKIASATSLPLVVAGPDWTRSKVVKAVKYGACDILLTPASPDEIRAKVEAHLGLSVICPGLSGLTG